MFVYIRYPFSHAGEQDSTCNAFFSAQMHTIRERASVVGQVTEELSRWDCGSLDFYQRPTFCWPECIRRLRETLLNRLPAPATIAAVRKPTRFMVNHSPLFGRDPCPRRQKSPRYINVHQTLKAVHKLCTFTTMDLRITFTIISGVYSIPVDNRNSRSQPRFKLSNTTVHLPGIRLLSMRKAWYKGW